jgi:paired amphipathic helix protein Sin3a
LPCYGHLTIFQVYSQVTALFNDAPDLLDEFKQFLPDTSQPGSSGNGGLFGVLGQASNQPQKEKRKEEAPLSKRRAAPQKDDVARPSKRGKKETPYAPRPTPPAQSTSKGPGRKSGISQTEVLEVSSSRFEQLPPAPRHYYPQPPPPPVVPPKPAISQEDVRFFDSVYKFIDDRQTYHEFLKLLNLFTQDIIDLPSLVSRAHLFLGGAPELWAQFREMVGWHDGHVEERKVEGGVWIIENEPAVKLPVVDWKHSQGYGPSYTKLPDGVSALH